MRSVNTNRAKFLNFLCMYKMMEQNTPIDFTDMNTTTKSDYYSCLKKLSDSISTHLVDHREDGFAWYLKGLVALKLGGKANALMAFCKAVNYEPMLWEAWNEMTALIEDRVTVFEIVIMRVTMA